MVGAFALQEICKVKALQRRFISYCQRPGDQLCCFNDYVDLLGEITKYGINDILAQIYNCDESGMQLEYKMPKVIAVKGTKKVRQCTAGSKLS